MKYDWRRISFAAAVFQTRQAYQYAKPGAAGDFTYVQQGEQKNTGLELSANGWATERLQISTSVAAIRARVTGSGTPQYEAHQAINVPKLRASVYADYALPWVNGLAVLGGVQCSARSTPTAAAMWEVGDYAVVNVGSRYTTKVDGYDGVPPRASTTCSTSATGATRVSTWAMTISSKARH